MKQALIFMLALAAAATTATAATYVVPPDDELIEQAEVIVLGDVGAAEARAVRGIRTYASIRVIEVLKGSEPFEPGHVFEVSAQGGAVGSRALIVPGAPRYRTGDKVLVFLARNEAGEWTTLHMALGKFRSVRRQGRDLLLRGEDKEPIVGFTPDGRPHREPERDEEGFKRYVRERARGQSPPRNYVVSPRPFRISEPEVEVATLAPLPATLPH